MIEPLDSYYLYVKQQMATIDPNQKFGPVIMSRDWPQTPVMDSALYLLLVDMMPIAPSSPAVMLYSYDVQWIWLLIGEDIQKNERKQNRGDRYREYMKIVNNLRDACFPGFCPKLSYTSDKNGQLTSYSYDSNYKVGGAETVWWSTPQWSPRFDAEKSGVLYGSARVELCAYDDILWLDDLMRKTMLENRRPTRTEVAESRVK